MINDGDALVRKKERRMAKVNGRRSAKKFAKEAREEESEANNGT